MTQDDTNINSETKSDPKRLKESTDHISLWSGDESYDALERWGIIQDDSVTIKRSFMDTPGFDDWWDRHSPEEDMTRILEDD